MLFLTFRPNGTRRILVVASTAAALAVIHGYSLEAQQPFGPTLYRLDPGSTIQRGCLDPSYCEVPDPVPLRGTFVMSYQYSGLQHVQYEISDVNWRAEGSQSPLLGEGRHLVRDQFGVFQVTTLNLNEFGGAPFTGVVPGLGNFPDLDVTLSAELSESEDAVIVLRASPVPPGEVRWHRLLGGSSLELKRCGTVESRALSGTFGLVPLSSQSREQALVNVRWVGLPPHGSDPSSILVTGFGMLTGRAFELILSEDARAAVLLDGEAGRGDDARRFRAEAAGGEPCLERTIRLNSMLIR